MDGFGSERSTAGRPRGVAVDVAVPDRTGCIFGRRRLGDGAGRLLVRFSLEIFDAHDYVSHWLPSEFSEHLP